jgi:recombination DNA repair RAD52 pathway protein
MAGNILMENETKKPNGLEKARAAQETKDRMMLAPSDVLNSKQLLWIVQKTPKSEIYTRRGKGSRDFTYVKGSYIKKVLNYVFGWQWDSEIKEHGREGNQVWCLVRLTVKDKKGQPRIIKEQFGRADIKIFKGTSTPVDFGNDLKAAATDGLKKCAAELGIANDVYNQEEVQDINEPDIQPKPKPNNTADMVLGTINMIHKIKDVKTLASTRANVKAGVERKVYTEAQGRVIMAHINDQEKLCRGAQ